MCVCVCVYVWFWRVKVFVLLIPHTFFLPMQLQLMLNKTELQNKVLETDRVILTQQLEMNQLVAEALSLKLENQKQKLENQKLKHEAEVNQLKANLTEAYSQVNYAPRPSRREAFPQSGAAAEDSSPAGRTGSSSSSSSSSSVSGVLGISQGTTSSSLSSVRGWESCK